MRDKWYRNSPPPECEKYLITDDCGNLQVAYWTDNSPITGEPSNVWRWIGLIRYTHVIAWRPLPEPYSEPVKHGRWIENSDPGQNINEHYMCSECGCTFHNWANDNYCPNCGCKIDLDGDSL